MKKLRIFAGPNGSGKSTLTSIIKEKFKMGVYVNADEIKVSIREKSKLSFSDFRIEVQKTSFLEALGSTSFDTSDNAGRWQFQGNELVFMDVNSVSDYFIAFLSDFIRQLYTDCRKLSASIMNFIKELKGSDLSGAKYKA